MSCPRCVASLGRFVCLGQKARARGRGRGRELLGIGPQGEKQMVERVDRSCVSRSSSPGCLGPLKVRFKGEVSERLEHVVMTTITAIILR